MPTNFFLCLQSFAKSASSVSFINLLLIISLSLTIVISETQLTFCSTLVGIKCTDPNAKCVKRINSHSEFCECVPGFIYEPFAYPYCLKPIPNGERCANSMECQHYDFNSRCSYSKESICECVPGYQTNYNLYPYCIKSISFGQSCSHSAECQLSDVNSSCSSGNPAICECNLNHVYNKNTTKCESISSHSSATIINKIQMSHILIITCFIILGATIIVGTKICKARKKLKRPCDSNRTESRLNSPTTITLLPSSNQQPGLPTSNSTGSNPNQQSLPPPRYPRRAPAPAPPQPPPPPRRNRRCDAISIQNESESRTGLCVNHTPSAPPQFLINDQPPSYFEAVYGSQLQ